PLFQVPEPV
nr:Chain P, 9-meric peptide from Alpha-fetoprotein [Homo sapiens]